MRAAHRIVLPAVAAWLTAAALIGVPDAAWIATAVGAVATVTCTVIAALGSGRNPRRREPVRPERRSAGWALAAVTVAAATLAATAIAARQETRTPEQLVTAAEASRSVTVRLLVTEKSVIDDENSPSPWDRSTDATEQARAGTSQRVRGTIAEFEIGNETYSASVPALLFATVRDEHPVAIGSVLEASAALRVTPAGDAAAVLLFAGRPATLTEGPPWYLAWAAGLRSGFVDAASALPGGGGELLPGLAVGDTTAVSRSLDEAMKSSSLSHLTAVSGANCAVIVAVLTGLLAAVGAPRRIRITGALIGLGFFVLLVTPEPSVIRAALMALAVLLALGAGRPSAGVPVLSLVVLVVVIADPWLSRSYGFVLSALATAGLLTLTGPLTRLLARILPRWLAATMAIPLAAQLACQPVLILLAPALPVLGVPANLLAAPAAPIATLLGLIGCLLTPIFAPAAGLALWLGWIPATWISAIATAIHALPATSLPWLPGAAGALLLAILTAVFVVALRAVETGNRMRAVVGAVILVVAGGAYAGSLAAHRFAPALAMPADWSHAACDVGQGDAILVRSGDAVALIDTGADPRLLTACLDTLAIGRLDLLVLTHFDLDHVGGVAAVVGRADRVLSGEPQNATDERILTDLAAGGATMSRGIAGGTDDLGPTRWRVLWPPARSDGLWVGNAGSVTMVFESESDGIRSLFLGDLGEAAQERILAGHRLGGPVDLVKMAHHGSADQSARIYLAASASIGLITVGADNGYGHPTPAALAMLAAAGTTGFRTDRCGLIVVGGTGANPVVWTERRC